MYWCLMACPGLTSGHSREIIEVPFKSFPHWKPLTELQEDICNVTILKCSVIAIQNDMKTEYEQLRPISPIKVTLNKKRCLYFDFCNSWTCLPIHYQGGARSAAVAWGISGEKWHKTVQVTNTNTDTNTTTQRNTNSEKWHKTVQVRQRQTHTQTIAHCHIV